MRTLSDWLSHASTTTDPLEREACIGEALTLASSCHDFRTLLAGMALLPLASTRLIDVANRTLELGHAEGAVWAFRDVATLRAARFDDERGAREALEACESMFRKPRMDFLGHMAAMLGDERPSTKGYEWVLLGQGFIETLHDEEGMRRCLEAGRDMARAASNADDLCSIAVAWAKHVNHEEGAALLREAEAMAENGTVSPWTLSNGWSSLDDTAGRKRVLDSALKRVSACKDAQHIARAFRSHDDRDGVRRALTRAEKLAKTAADWLEIADIVFDARLGEADLRRVIERAEAAAVDLEEKGNVARAYAQRLHDEVAAARVGPRGVRPEHLRTRVRTLADWETSASGLFDWLRARATNDTLSYIASSDPFSADKHVAALHDICETGLLPRRLSWEPHEALALTRWSAGERVQHLERALATALLCLVPDDMEELVVNGAILTESCLALGDEPTQLAQRFFAWRAENEDDVVAADDCIGPEHPVALLFLFMLRTAEAPDDPRLEALSVMLTEHPIYKLDFVAKAIADSMVPALWGDLFSRLIVPHASRPAVARVLRGLGR